MKHKLLYNVLITLLLTALSGLLYAQSYSASESIERSAAVPADVDIILTNHSADLIISTTNSNQICIKTEIQITGSSKEDADMVLKAIKNLEFELHGNTFEIDTRFYKNMMTIRNKTTMTLQNGDKVKIKEFRVKHELSIPKSASLKLDSKYSDIDLGDIEGEADFVLYSTKINMGNVGLDSEMSLKYSKAFIGDVKNIDLDLYDSDIVFQNAGDVEIKSKYSNIEGDKTGKLIIDSYDDKYKINAIPDVKINAKYSDFEFSSDINNVELDFYDSNFSAKNVTNGTFNGKYSELIFDSIKTLNISYSYDNKFELGKTKKVSVTESKYSDYFIKNINSFRLNGYDDNIHIEKLASGFEGPVNVSGKYIKLDIDSNGEPFQFQFNIKYPKYELPENVKIIKHIEESSNLELVGNDSGGKIIVDGYDMRVKIQ